MTGSEIATIAYDLTSGATLWTTRFDEPTSDDDYPYGAEVSPDGTRVYVTGSAHSSTASDFVTLAYDASTGSQLWSATYDGTGHRFDFARALDVSPDGSSIYVAGSSDGSRRSADYATVAYDAAGGEALWVARYDDPAGRYDYPEAVQVSPDGGTVIVTGGDTAKTDGHTVAYDSSSGAERWTAIYDGPEHLDDGLVALVVSPDGRTVFVAGSSRGANGRYRFATIAYRV
jgi:DNA-binding beta-propeller fold protein YncE